MIEPLTYLVILASVAVTMLCMISYYLEQIRQDIAVMRLLAEKTFYHHD